ncbi:hypothetical protein MD535_08175 [Vibrio sp. ZSDZ65]|uniref:Uncharacterized protein n=1 Tax=Vibrio qingdaonensis TaxID=2829491 RepID=A0A9X3HW82_9VIBR|nr:anti-phage protein KwaA [Vibrio qingdaonensis]MCW8345983.1 hypothetical protein [Vibrio qingdaonensis]
MVDNKFKIKLYILSLALLFLIVFVMTVTLPDTKLTTCNAAPCTTTDLVKQYLLSFLSVNVIPIIMLILMATCWYIKHDFDYMLEGGGQQVIRVQSVQNEDFEHLTFLATYIIPFFGFTFDDPRRLLAYLILLVIIGIMFIKTNKYYANPTLAVLGFKLYKANLSDRNGIYESVTLISRDRVSENDVVTYKLISENVFYISRIRT